MKMDSATRALSALSHAHRLAAFRLLVQAGPEGLPAGEIASALGISPPALSFHLSQLSTTGLVRTKHAGRFVYYRADFDAMNALLAFLTENCCGGNPCTPAPRLGASKRRRLVES
ncbi:MAG TPA: metalloregulator ArsR/SmtB family transcription factor [Burkholderiales bacterium]|nr:metalloregulator ArsR/SmtB family transcription factor [Burkholderiales bacterium]